MSDPKEAFEQVVTEQTEALQQLEEYDRSPVASSYRSDGLWSCTEDHRTEPCGECDGCRQVQAENRIDPVLQAVTKALWELTHDSLIADGAAAEVATRAARHAIAQQQEALRVGGVQTTHVHQVWNRAIDAAVRIALGETKE